MAGTVERSCALRLRQVSAGYGDRTVVRDVDLDLAPRHTFVLMGPAGGGKSTLVRGILEASRRAGSFIENREDWSPPEGFWSSGEVSGPLGPVHVQLQRHRSPSSSTGAANGAGPAPVAERIEFWTSRIREDSRRRTAPASEGPARSGEVFALPAIESPGDSAADHPVWIFDEPTLDLSDVEAGQVRRFLEWARGRATILLVTHDRRLARAVGDAWAVLLGGVLAAAGDDLDELVPCNPLISAQRLRWFLEMGS